MTDIQKLLHNAQESPQFFVVDRTVERGDRDLAIGGPFATSEEANQAKRWWRVRGCAGAMVMYARPRDLDYAPGGIQ